MRSYNQWKHGFKKLLILSEKEMPRIYVKETFYNFIHGIELGAQKGRRGGGMGRNTLRLPTFLFSGGHCYERTQKGFPSIILKVK